MEALYSKLYDKYTKIKTKKYSGMEQLNLDQEEKFKNYVSAADELVEYLVNEKDRLCAQLSDLRQEVASIRAAKDDEIIKYEKLLLEENQKNKELIEEIERLHRKEPHSSSRDDMPLNELVSEGSPLSPERTSSSVRRKRHRVSNLEKEVGVAVNFSDQIEHALAGESENALPKENTVTGAMYSMNQPKCCRRRDDSSANASDPTNCMFQELVECLVDLKFSIVNQTDDIHITAVHESSGYSFNLKWVKNSAGEEEFMYDVSSLGTFERVAPEWMREVMLFSKSMCRIFFKRVSSIVKLQN